MTYYHPLIPNSLKDIETSLLQTLGIADVNELFNDIPQRIRLQRSLHIPFATSEREIEQKIEELLHRNLSLKDASIFLGGGFSPHYVPPIVEEIVNRTEFMTSYTPYQPEISQGILQVLFEFQSMISELTGMDYANCSMYDWSSSLGEAARMTNRITRRQTFLIPEYLSPNRRRVLQTYTESAKIQLKEYVQDQMTGQVDLEKLKALCDDKTAGIYVENPSYLGFVEEEVKSIAEIAHDVGALFITGIDPISLGIFRSPGDYGADIVIGEGQPLGLGLNFGGPGLGIFACKGDSLLRQMPGRIISLTKTVQGDHDAFCMALQTREQHIRREKATSNICTNNALCAVAAVVYLSLLGSTGLTELGKNIAVKTKYAIRKLNSIPGVEAPVFTTFHFKEFTVRFNKSIDIEDLNTRLLKHNIYGGLNLKTEFPKLGNTSLFCVTEIHSENDINRLTDVLQDEVN